MALPLNSDVRACMLVCAYSAVTPTMQPLQQVNMWGEGSENLKLSGYGHDSWAMSRNVIKIKFVFPEEKCSKCFWTQHSRTVCAISLELKKYFTEMVAPNPRIGLKITRDVKKSVMCFYHFRTGCHIGAKFF